MLHISLPRDTRPAIPINLMGLALRWGPFSPSIEVEWNPADWKHGDTSQSPAN
jgi:hypothetical protein